MVGAVDKGAGAAAWWGGWRLPTDTADHRRAVRAVRRRDRRAVAQVRRDYRREDHDDRGA